MVTLSEDERVIVVQSLDRTIDGLKPGPVRDMYEKHRAAIMRALVRDLEATKGYDLTFAETGASDTAIVEHTLADVLLEEARGSETKAKKQHRSSGENWPKD